LQGQSKSFDKNVPISHEKINKPKSNKFLHKTPMTKSKIGVYAPPKESIKKKKSKIIQTSHKKPKIATSSILTLAIPGKNIN